MKKIALCVLCMTAAMTAWAGPTRVALLEFEDQTGLKPDAMLGGTIAPGAVAAKGVFLLSKRLLGDEAFVLIDRRDFIAQVEALKPTDMGRLTPTKPSFIHAAQALNADVILRGSLMSFSTGKQNVNQGGYHTEMSTLSIRIGLEALDAVDGTVIALADGTASRNFRQTVQHSTTLGEEDVLGVMEKAIDKALPDLERALGARVQRMAARPKVKISVTTTADPALVEIDGILIGTSPLTNYEIYRGDHVLTIGKPGYRDMTKRIMFEKDSLIEVPMMRIELSAEELKEVLENARLHIIQSDIQPALLIKDLE